MSTHGSIHQQFDETHFPSNKTFDFNLIHMFLLCTQSVYVASFNTDLLKTFIVDKVSQIFAGFFMLQRISYNQKLDVAPMVYYLMLYSLWMYPDFMAKVKYHPKRHLEKETKQIAIEPT